jgi:gamma-glutamyl-gamma-aminobutyrate hydrolase PuuD
MSELPPRIGLTAYREVAAWGVWREPADLLPVTYAAAVHEAGGAAILLPPGARHLEPAAESVLDGLHGLLLTGGPDVDPAHYGALRDSQTSAPRPDRDGWEITLARAALRRGIPLLGVCRGMQVLAVATGGSLVQHLPDVVGHDGHCPAVGAHGRHRVRLAAGSRVAAVAGGDAEVATYHHQAVDRLPDSVVATGWAEDGTIEAIEVAGAVWRVGVQWHPEVHNGADLFDAFVKECASARDGRAPRPAQRAGAR